MVKRLKRTIALIGLVALGVVTGGSQARAVCDPVPATKIGDVNGSGFIDVNDVLTIIKTAFTNGPQSRYLGSDDLDGSGFTDVNDVLREISIAFTNGSTNFPFRIYKLTGRIGAGSWQLVKDTSLQYRIYGEWSIGSDTVNGRVDTVSVCPKVDTLLIPPGEVVQGDTSHAVPSAIVIRRTGYVQCVGTFAQPIVFTSMMPVGSRNRSDWGGFVINGCAPNNNRPAYIENTEGGLNVGIGGGNIPHDNSGCFRYLREEYSGREFSLDNELNGITVNSVGDGTTLEYFEVIASADDGIEWFGGTVGINHALVYDYDDDGFDSDVGAQWKGQFMLSIQDETEGFSPNHEGEEWDNHPDPATEHDNLPRMTPTVWNMTSVGMGHCPIAAENKGIMLRRGAGADVNNAIWTRFDASLDVDNAATFAQIGIATNIHNSVFYDCNRQADDADGFEAALVAGGAPFFNMQYLNPCPSGTLSPILVAGSFTDPGFPNFRPVVPAPVPLPPALVPPPPFDPSGTYLGAVAPGTPPGTAWYEGWTNWAKH